MKRLCFGAILVLGLLVIVRGQDTPCPGIFEYKNDGGEIYGVIHLRPSMSVNMVQIQANFTIAARLVNNYYGRLELIGNGVRNFNGGLDYRVDFPTTNPLPRLTALVVNDNIVCYGPGDIAGPNNYVSTATLSHTLFLKGGFNGFNTFEKPQTSNTIYHMFGYQPVDPEGITFHENEDPWTIHEYIRRPEQVGNPYEQPHQEPVRTTEPPPVYYPQPVVTRHPRPPLPLPQNIPRAPEGDIQTISNQCGLVSGGNERQPLIFGGNTYARGDWPWLVAIYRRREGGLTFICSGTLVTDRHVVTAAHCMQQKSSSSSNRDIVVKVGVYNLDDWGDDISVTRTLASATIHESYNSTSLANDILVMTFERSVEFNTNIRPACLWSGNTDLNRIVGASGAVAGWGQSEFGEPGRGEPRVVRIPVVSTSVCRASKTDFHTLTSDNTLCAGGKGSGPCLGDSGGGMYLLEGGRWRLRGIVSLSLRPENGDASCNLDAYIVFTDSAKYLNWINQVIRSN